MKLLARPRAVVVPLCQALVFVNAEQDERLLGPGIHEARRGGFGVFQRLHLLVGQFDHGCLLSVIVQPREFQAGWPQGIAPLGLPQIRTCTFAHTAPHIMSSLRDGCLSESAIRLVPDAATVVGSCTRLWVSMHPPCVPPTVS